MRKVTTDENLADALTRHVSAEELNYHLSNTGQVVAEGRHELAPETTEINHVDYPDVNDCTCQSSLDQHCVNYCSCRNYLQQSCVNYVNYAFAPTCHRTCTCNSCCFLNSFLVATMPKEECRIMQQNYGHCTSPDRNSHVELPLSGLANYRCHRR